MYPLIYPSKIRLPTMQMHSFRSSTPPCTRTARSISSSSTLLPTSRYSRLTRFLHSRMRMRSMSRQMPRFSHTFWYFWLSSSQNLKLHSSTAFSIDTYSLNSSRSAELWGLNILPSSILQGIRQRRTSFFWARVRRVILEKHSSASLRFSLTRAYLPRWKLQLSMYRGPHSPQILFEQRMRWICSQLWNDSRIDTCMMSISGRNSFFTSSPIARADLNRCSVFSSVFFSFAAAELCVTLLSADRKMRLVALSTVRRGLDSHSRQSFISSSTFTTAIRHCMCFSKASDHLPAARSAAKSLASYNTLAKLRPTTSSESPKTCELMGTFQLFSGMLAQLLVKQSSLSSLESFSPSFFWKLISSVLTKVLAVLRGRYESWSSDSILIEISIINQNNLLIKQLSQASLLLLFGRVFRLDSLEEHYRLDEDVHACLD